MPPELPPISTPACGHCGAPPAVQWRRRTGPDTVEAVFACREHPIDVEAAAYVHGPDCSAPHPDHLPACDCDPEPHPSHASPRPADVVLPTGWVVTQPEDSAGQLSPSGGAR